MKCLALLLLSVNLLAQGIPPMCDPNDPCGDTDHGCNGKCAMPTINLMQVTAASHFVHTHGIK